MMKHRIGIVSALLAGFVVGNSMSNARAHGEDECQCECVCPEPPPCPSLVDTDGDGIPDTPVVEKKSQEAIQRALEAIQQVEAQNAVAE